MQRHAKKYDFPMDLAIFTKVLPTDGPTNGPTDQRMDIPSYRDAMVVLFLLQRFTAFLLNFFQCEMRLIELCTKLTLRGALGKPMMRGPLT